MFQDQEPHSQSNLQKFSDLYIFLNIQNERFSYSLKLQLISLERRTSNCEGDSKFEIQDSNLNLNLNLEYLSVWILEYLNLESFCCDIKSYVVS